MDSIIFDLDGTLWDSRKEVADSWNEVLRQREDIDVELTPDDLKRTMGLQIHEIGRILFPQLTEQQQKDLMDECCTVENQYISKTGAVLYPELEPVLKQLAAKYRLFIVSNCQEGYIEAFYEAHGLDKYFDDFENPGRTGLSKGENIQLVMERNKLTSPVYVGDTEGDRKAAQHAGIPFVYASYGFGEVENYDYELREFKDLLTLF